MRLSRLHIAGFKSFPDRAELGFDDGVTAIVGPNGCGKSNVVDAITWVLGEQSVKSLRGERMEDVIFNGSDARKPTAAAEVRLKLSQVARAAMVAASADEAEDEVPLLTRDVEIGRRLYRSGESEYLIDGEVCRLRDVHDLLMDSGLGVKAYAVIEQGKIGQILSSRPAERRLLIEEAAGVTKYKSRRRAAELKLEAAHLNLTRVDDIIFEVEKQRGALKRQASRARRYRRLREELRKWEQVQLARRYEHLAREAEAAESRLEEARARAAVAAGHVAELEAALEALRLGLTENEAQATTTRELAHARELEIGRRQQQVQFDRQQIEELKRQAEVLSEEARELEARREPARQAAAARREAARTAAGDLDAARAEAERRQAEHARALAAVQAVERESDAIRAAVLAAGTTLSALRQARENAVAVRDRVAAELERLGLEARELGAEAERARQEHDECRRALADRRAAHERALRLHAEAERALSEQRAGHELAAGRLGALQRDAAAKEARLRSLEEIEASRATFGDAARFLLAEAKDAIRQHGAVADHLGVEPSYERAVDALLGELLQYVLVDRPEDLQTGLSLLADRHVGRCGFLVLAAAHEPAEAPPPLVVPPGAQALSTVVRASGPHATAVTRIIGRALIVESFEAAAALARVVSVPVATRSGEVFHGPWLVQGGARQAHGILETRAEVRLLGEEVAGLHTAIGAAQAEMAALASGIEAGGQHVASLRDEYHDCEKAIVALEAQAGWAADEQARVQRRIDVVESERARAAGEQVAAEERRDGASTAIDAQESGQRAAEANLGAVSSRLQACRDEADACLRLVTESRTREAALTERASALTAEVARLDEAGQDLEARLAARQGDIERTVVRRRELQASILETERQLDADVQTMEELQREIRALDERVVALRGEFTEREHGIRSARHALDGIRAAATDLEVSRARAAADLAHLEHTCVEAVGLPLEEVVAIVARLEDAGELVPPAMRAASGDDEDEADATPLDEETPVTDTGDDQSSSGAVAGPDQVIALLRRRIERLGPVNMMAIEQFDELEARHGFLTTQRKDLLDSIAQTGDAIRRIDKTTRERFAEAFESITRNFEGTFTTLFGGGRAGLILIDQENDPESGIDIIAQPPGKRLQNVQLLSGGEKALTAMALMFAIFQYRPSPFCLLDEIDAPLDDANIGRFVEMLQGMQAHTQFILITHNRKTMEIADRLYGVTMEEPGVSKLISVQLN
jgi:chromosome segregation protein